MPDRSRVIIRAGHYVVLPPRSADQLFLMGLCVLSSIGILSGADRAPGTIEASMPFWAVMVWAGVLLLGSVVVMVAYLVKDRVNSIIVEQFGSVCLAVAAFLYGILVIFNLHDDGGTIPGILILGFAFTRAYQARYYQKTLNNVHEVMALAQGEEKADGD